MRYQDLSSFEKHLHSSAPLHLAKIYLLISEESYERQLALNQILSLLAPDPKKRSLMTTVFSIQQGVDFLRQELNSLSFFVKEKILVAEGIEKVKTDDLKEILPLIYSFPQGITLIFQGNQLRSNTLFYKAIEKEGVILDLSNEGKPWEKEKRMTDWLKDRAQQQGKVLGFEAARIMVAQLGTDRALLANELEKAITFCGERSEVTAKEIYAVCCTVNQETGWKLGEAVFQRQTSRALEILKALLDEGTSLIALLRQLRSQFQTKVHIASILDRGGTPLDITAVYGYMRGQILDQNLRLTKNYGSEALRRGLIKIDESEVVAKNSAIEPDLIAEILITKLTS